MKFKVVIHSVPEEEGGGYWAEVPALPGCVTEADTKRELLHNLREAIGGYLESLEDEKKPKRGRGVEVRLLAV